MSLRRSRPEQEGPKLRNVPAVSGGRPARVDARGVPQARGRAVDPPEACLVPYKRPAGCQSAFVVAALLISERAMLLPATVARVTLRIRHDGSKTAALLRLDVGANCLMSWCLTERRAV